jgi:predicted GIY-YIG superfamily endonuclease
LSKDYFVYFVYVLKCVDGSYYVGSTQDIASRVQVHNSGMGPSFTAARLPVKLIYQESFATRTAAVQRERQLKRWSRAKKGALVSGDLNSLKSLAASRSEEP